MLCSAVARKVFKSSLPHTAKRIKKGTKKRSAHANLEKYRCLKQKKSFDRVLKWGRFLKRRPLNLNICSCSSTKSSFDFLRELRATCKKISTRRGSGAYFLSMCVFIPVEQQQWHKTPTNGALSHQMYR